MGIFENGATPEGICDLGGNVDGGSTVQIGGDGGFLGIPTAIWAVFIPALATVAAALIALKKKA